MEQIVALRQSLKDRGWILLAHSEGRYGTAPLHYYAFGHPNGSWVYGMGPNELMALNEVQHKIVKYKLHDGPMPTMPFQISHHGHKLELHFARAEDAERFSLWIQRISK